MADPTWQGPTAPASLRRALRMTLRRLAPGLRVVAEDVLAEVSSMDLLAVGEDGELVSIRIASEPEREPAEGTIGAALLARGLADLAWLRPRAADLIKIAPGLGLELGAEPRALLFAPRFGAEVVAAAENLPARMLQLYTWRGLRHQGQLELLLEPLKPGLLTAGARPAAAESARIDAAQTPATGERPDAPEAPSLVEPAAPRPVADPGSTAPVPTTRRLTDPPSSSSFRTGLTDADLRLESRVG